MAQANAVTGVLTKAADVVVLPVEGLSGASIQLTGVFVGTVTFEGSNDGVNFSSLNAVLSSGSTLVTTTTGTGLWTVSTPGLHVIQVRLSAYTSGTVSVLLRGAMGSPAYLSAAGVGGAVTVADGADVAEGATTDAAVTGDNAGTLSAKLRGLDKIVTDVWDSVNHWFKVSIQNATLAVTQSGAWGITVSTTGGWTPAFTITSGAANQDANTIKASAGQVGYIAAGNSTTSIRYLKIYDKASGPTSADTPVIVMLLPGNTTGAGSNLLVFSGATCTTGIGFRVTTGAANNDVGAAATNEVLVNIGYK